MGVTPMDVLAKSVVAQTKSQHAQTVWHCTDESDGTALTRICQPETAAPKTEPAAPVPVATPDSPASYPSNDAPITTVELIVPASSDSAKPTLPVDGPSAQAAAIPANPCSQGSAPATARTTQNSLDLSSTLPVAASAEEVAIQDTVAQFDGNVEFVRGDATLLANQAIYNRESQFIELRGDVVASTPFAMVYGSRAEINLLDNSSYIEEATYQLNADGMRGSANSVSIDPSKRVKIEQGSYTRCPASNKVWQVQAKTLNLDPQSGQGVATNAQLKIYDVPVFYLPYARFPIGDQRQSGLLFPRLADTNSGVDFAVPYYLNLATNIDATLIPRYKENSGYLTEATLRWLNPFDEWELNTAYLDRDEQLNDSRWLVDIKEIGATDSGFSSAINFTKISDIDYLRDLDTTSLSVNRATHLSQQARLAYDNTRWSVGASVQQYQTIDINLDNEQRPYETRPELWVNYQTLPQPFTIGAKAELRLASYEHVDLVDGDRGYGNIEFDLPMRWAGLTLTPTLGIQHLDYRLSADSTTDNTQNNNPSFTASYGSLAMQTVFEKPIYRGNTLTKINTIEPRLRYFYRGITSNKTEQQNTPLLDSDWLTVDKNLLHRDSRYSGYDVLEDSNQLAASITRKSYNSQGLQRTALTIGQLFYFQDMLSNGSDLTNSFANEPPASNSSSRHSALIAEIEVAGPSRSGLYSIGSLQWDSEQNQVEYGAWSLRYRAPAGGNVQRGISVANLGYRYRKSNINQPQLTRNIEQVDASVVSAINSQWGMLGRYQYDLANHRSIETLAGLQFNDCCIQLRLVYRDGVIYEPNATLSDSLTNPERDRSIYFQIEFKGLAGVGRALENVLEESIFGYRAP